MGICKPESVLIGNVAEQTVEIFARGQAPIDTVDIDQAVGHVFGNISVRYQRPKELKRTIDVV